MKPEYENTYYFSVEGQTERLYLKWLEDLINKESGNKYKVFFDVVVTPYPSKRVKNIPKNIENTLYHLCDYESNDPYHKDLFRNILDQMAQAKKKKFVKDYLLGYSNQTFELWMILHKMDYFAPNVHRKNYVQQINKAYKTNYRGNQEYKREDSFKKLLKTLTLDDVLAAIQREKAIMKRNKNLDYQLFEYKGYNYYQNNPSTSVGSIIEKILIENGLING